MNIAFSDKIRAVVAAYSVIGFLPTLKKQLALLLRPFDAPRYVEFAYLLKFMKERSMKGLHILDVSSPHIMSYILCRNNQVVKTDIDISEKNLIKENKNLKFQVEDATHLSFGDNSFDLVYSVSVIEHIYEMFLKAMLEMSRVVKIGGFIYLTFPVSHTHTEEWSKNEVYSDQFVKDDRTFFQYRFDQNDIDEIIKKLKESGVLIIQKDIFWEKKEGMYDRLINNIKWKSGLEYIDFLNNAALNIWYGLNMFRAEPAKDFLKAKSFGNMHLVLQKIQ